MFKLLLLTVTLMLIAPNVAEAGDGGKLVGTYAHGKRTFNVNALPDWQEKLYEELGIPEDTRLLMRTVQQLECNHPHGFCKNKYDAGPFQINVIHGEDSRYSRSLVNEGLERERQAKLSGDWSGVLETRDVLFKFQAQWTYDRMRRLAKQYGKKVNYDALPRTKQVWYQAVWHNGNTAMQGGRQFRFWYGDKAVKHFTVLTSVQETKPKPKPHPKPKPKPKRLLTDKVEKPFFPDLEAYVRKRDFPATGKFFITSLE